MVKLALFVRLEAKPGKEKEVENLKFLGLRDQPLSKEILPRLQVEEAGDL